MIFERIETLIDGCMTGLPAVPSAQFGKDGWMLRLTLDLIACIDLKDGRHPLTVPLGSRLYSEALLPNDFLPGFQGDAIAESRTHADAFIGHYDIGNGMKGDSARRPDSRHLVVIDAKMYSKLSACVNKTSGLNQDASNTACSAEVLKRAIRQVQEFKKIGFYVFSSQINHGLFDAYLTQTSLNTVLERRAGEYNDRQSKWVSGWFLPTFDRLDIKSICWQDLIAVRYPDAEPLKTSILAAWN